MLLIYLCQYSFLAMWYWWKPTFVFGFSSWHPNLRPIVVVWLTCFTCRKRRAIWSRFTQQKISWVTHLRPLWPWTVGQPHGWYADYNEHCYSFGRTACRAPQTGGSALAQIWAGAQCNPESCLWVRTEYFPLGWYKLGKNAILDRYVSFPPISTAIWDTKCSW